VTGKFLFQLHLHTCASHDARASIEQYAIRAKKLKLAGFAVTDHDATVDLDEVQRVSAEHGITIIPGIEVSTPQGDLVGLFVSQKPSSNHINDAARSIAEQDGVVYFPHPCRNRSLDEVDYSVIDLIEIFNSRCRPDENVEAEELASAHNIHGISGADAHRVSDMGLATVSFDSENPDEVKRSLKAGHYNLHNLKYTPQHGIIYAIAVAHYRKYPFLTATLKILRRIIRRIYRR
jgi:predicted metal-dependent phosphoesterase TrpH